MYKKLLTIKTILRIVVLSFVIISMCKSCAEATTFNMTECDSKWTTEAIATELINYFSPNYTHDTKALQWIDNIKDYDYSCFCVDWGTYTHRIYCWILQESGYFNGLANSNNFRTYYNANNLSWIIDFSTSSNKPTNVFSATNTNFKNQGMNFDSVYMVCNADNKFYEGGSSSFKLANLTPPKPNFNFVFLDQSITASVPNGETAYCVFLDPIQNYQKIGYIENFEEHKNTQIQIFAQNYRNPDNVLVNSIGENNYILNESGELLVNTNTMWTALVYEIVGIDNGPSGDFLNGENFIAYYYIGAGTNVSGDPLFNGYDANYDNNQFFLWKLLGNIGDGSGDSGSGILGGIGTLFIPSSEFFLNYFNSLNNWLTAHLGFIYTPFEIVINLFNRILTIDYSNPHVEIGPYTLPLNDDYELIPKITYNFNDLLLNQEFKDLYDIYLIIVDGLIYTGFLYLCYCKYEEIIGGNKQ